MNAERYFFTPENFLIVARGFFAPEALRAVRRKIESRQAEVALVDERAHNAAEVGVAPDALRLDTGWYSIWKDADLSLLRQHVPQFTEIVFPPQIRTVRDLRSFVPWHQDAAYQQALGKRAHRHVMTCFVPLEDVAEGRPSLQFCIDPDQGRVEHLVRAEVTVNQFDLEERAKPDQAKCRTFDLALGDVYLFGQHVLHRTYAAADDFRSRTSMEFRLTTRDSVVAGKDYFSLDSMQFYLADNHG